MASFVFAWQQLEAAQLAALPVAASLRMHPVSCICLAHLLAGRLFFCHLGSFFVESVCWARLLAEVLHRQVLKAQALASSLTWMTVSFQVARS